MQARASPTVVETLRVVSMAVGEEVTQCVVRAALPQINRDLASVPTVNQYPTGHDLRWLVMMPALPALPHSYRREEATGTAVRRRDAV